MHTYIHTYIDTYIHVIIIIIIIIVNHRGHTGRPHPQKSDSIFITFELQ